jgi:hypothetical protein
MPVRAYNIDEIYFFLGAAFFVAFSAVLGLVLLPHPHPHPAISITSLRLMMII